MKAEQTQSIQFIHDPGEKNDLNIALFFFSSMNLLLNIVLHLNSIRSLFTNSGVYISTILLIYVTWAKNQPKSPAETIHSFFQDQLPKIEPVIPIQQLSGAGLQILLFLIILMGASLVDYIISLNEPKIALGRLLGIIILALLSNRILNFEKKKKVQSLYRLLVNLIGIASFSLVIFLFLEIGTRILVWQNVLPEVARTTELNETRPKPIPDDIYPGISNEIIQFVNLNLTNNEDMTLWLPENFDGKYYSVKNHIRGTTNQPEDYEHTIYIFGGSTIFSIDAIDYYTIPSHLQRLINQEISTKYRVVNMGVTGFNTGPQNIRLKTLDLEPGDIVIYYDGENNIPRVTSFGNYQAHPIPAAVIKANHQKSSQLPFMAEIWFFLLDNLYRILDSMSEKSDFIHYLHTFNWQLLKTPVNDPEWHQQIIDNSVHLYQQQIIEAFEYSTSEGAQFFHYLQPTLFAQDKFTEHEQKIINSFGVDYTYSDIQEKMVEDNVILTEMGVHSVDLTDVLAVENRPNNADIYYDHCHINYIGNQIVAEAIFNDLIPYLEK